MIMSKFNDFEAEVNNLRCEWINAICTRRRQTENGDEIDEEAHTNLARRIYESGLRAEYAKDLSVAVEQYRRATALVEDIESDMKPRLQTNPVTNDNRSNIETDNCTETTNIAKDFNEADEQLSPILRLPDELLFYIMRWIVGIDIDLYSLLLLNKVCQKFLSVSRDEQLWRMICQRLWPSSELKDCVSYNGSWRSMAIKRPHLLYHGCYIGSITYVRRGEPIASTYNRPILIVKYFRVFRFKRDGSVIMIMSTLEPQDIIKQITLLEDNDISTMYTLLSQSSISKGTFSIEDNKICLRMTRIPDLSSCCFSVKHHRRYRIEDMAKQIMDISLQIKCSAKRPNHILQWNSFSLNVVYKTETSHSTFDVNSDKYPKLVFSRVRAFCNRLSEAPV